MTEPNFLLIFQEYEENPSTNELFSNIINKFEDYLSSLIITTKDKKFIEMYNNNGFDIFKENLENIMNIIYSKYNKLCNKSSFTGNYAKLIDLLIIATIKLYEYIYIINNISKSIPYETFLETHRNSHIFLIL